MKRKILIIIAVIVVLGIGLVVLTGCGNKNIETLNALNVTNNETENTNTGKQENKTINRAKIGEYIHYNVNLDIGDTSSVDDDWVVFYENEEKGITYLISSNYVPTSNSAFRKAIDSLGLYVRGTYGVCSTNYDKMKTDIPSEVGEKYLLAHPEKSSAHKYRMMANFLDTEAWNGFVLKSDDGTTPFDSSIHAVGTPTLELWLASWEQKGYTPIKFNYRVDENKINCTGYYQENDEGITDFKRVYTYNLEKSGFKHDSDGNIIDKVYFTESPQDDKNCVCYWLASPPAASNVNNLLICVSRGGELITMGFDNGNVAIRPIVSLSSKLIGTDKTSELYYVGKNIND